MPYSVCFVSIIRIVMLKITAGTKDYTFDNVSVDLWSCVETNSTVAIACFMTMKPLLAKWFPRLTATGQNSHSRQQLQAITDTTGRALTIGTGPPRLMLVDGQQLWRLSQDKRGGENNSADEHEQKDLEAGQTGVPESANVKDSSADLQSFTSGTTL